MTLSQWRTGLIALLLAAFCSVGSLAFAQTGTTQTLSGAVVDSSSAVIPGANVVVKNTATGVATETVTNTDGVFSVPSLPPGSYDVTVKLEGFKTTIVNNVVLTAGAGANLKISLQVGGVSEEVTVSSTSEVVQTQTGAVSQTVNAAQIVKLPLTDRGAMEFVNLLPGVTTANGDRQASINGLSRTAINITLDGVNVQDNTLKGLGDDGFFAVVNPRLDAVEEVTVSTAAQGTDSTADGAAQIKFVTRSGSNTFTGSAYEYFRSDKFNANTWFNNAQGVAKVPLKQNQPGFRVGGPIVIPGFDGHNKAFFFANYEEFHAPSAVSRTRTILSPGAQAGNYCYASSCVNVLGLGAAPATDPTVGKLLADINSATHSTGTITTTGDPNILHYNFNIPVTSLRRYPTGRVDFNVTNNERISTAINYQYFTDNPDTLNQHEPAFPGFPVTASQTSKRMAISNSLRSTLTKDMVNEATVAYSWDPVSFFPQENASMFSGGSVDQRGFAISFPSVGSSLTGPNNRNPGPESRNAADLDITNNLTWLKGAHNITMGGQFSHYTDWQIDQTVVPRLSFQLQPNDPAFAFFTNANFPGASANQLSAAENLYALLTGRVSQVTADARLNPGGQYIFEGPGKQQGSLNEFAGYAQDQWRLKPNLTLNAGVRYDVQLPFQASNSIYTFGDITNICGISGTASANSCNLFQPGNAAGPHSVFQQYKAGVNSANTDWKSLGPSVSVAWTPQTRPGFLGPVMGSGDFVVRGGYSRAFTRPAIGDYTGIFSNNPGIVQSIVAPAATILGGAAPPLLLSSPQTSAPLAFQPTPIYPLSPTNVFQSIEGFDPNITIPYSDTWSAGIERSLGKNMALEVRYVGTHGYNIWGDYNYNEVDISKNGFENEFRQAQANLQANLNAGKGATFAYTGIPGTVPLPTFLGYFDGKGSANAGNPAMYTGSSWTNSTFLGFLAAQNPNPFGFLSTSSSNASTSFLGSAAFRANAAAAGVPANFFLANPDLIGGASVRSNQQSTYYNGLQTELRRRLSNGLQFQASYSFDRAHRTVFLGFIGGNPYRQPTGNEGDVTHQFKSLLTYDLPFGQGRRWGSHVNGAMNRVIGGWQVDVTSVVHSGALVDLGNVRLVGMTKSDVQNMFKVRIDSAGGAGLVYMLPADVIQQTIAAFNVSATSPTGYAGAAPTGRYFAPANGPDCIEPENSAVGHCGVGSLVVSGPLFQQHDISVVKQVKVVGHTNAEFHLEMLNAFNHPNFTPLGGIGGTNVLTNFQVTSLSGTNTSRVIQLVFRFNW